MSAILLTLNTARTSNLTYRTRKIKRSRVYYHLLQSQLGNEPEKSLPLKHNTCFHSVHLFLRFVLHTPIISHFILHALTLTMVSHMMKRSAYKLVRTYMWVPTFNVLTGKMHVNEALNFVSRVYKNYKHARLSSVRKVIISASRPL